MEFQRELIRLLSERLVRLGVGKPRESRKNKFQRLWTLN